MSYRHSLVLFLVLILAASPSLAQRFDAPLGALYVSAQPDAHEPFLSVATYTEFDFYLVAQVDYSSVGYPEVNPYIGIRAWEAGVTLAPEVTIVSVEVQPAGAIRIGDDLNWLVGLSEVVVADDTPRSLAHFRAVLVSNQDPKDVVIDLGPADPSSFEGRGPGWLEGTLTGACQLADGTPTLCKRRFAEVYGLVVNCEENCTLPVEDRSWGSMKASFGN